MGKKSDHTHISPLWQCRKWLLDSHVYSSFDQRSSDSHWPLPGGGLLVWGEGVWAAVAVTCVAESADCSHWSYRPGQTIDPADTLMVVLVLFNYYLDYKRSFQCEWAKNQSWPKTKHSAKYANTCAVQKLTSTTVHQVHTWWKTN